MRLAIAMICGFTMLAGCVNHDAAKTSHFEHDHEVAAHWPDDLADAAVKIRECLHRADHDHAPAQKHVHPHDHGDSSDHHHSDHHHGDHRHHRLEPGDEIADIVSWVPEIAADTDLSERDWIPLDNAAASLSANLRAADNELTKSIRNQAIALCELIEQSVAKVPEQLPSLQVSSR